MKNLISLSKDFLKENIIPAVLGTVGLIGGVFLIVLIVRVLWLTVKLAWNFI